MKASTKGCCNPSRAGGAIKLSVVMSPKGTYGGEVLDIPGGTAMMGTAQLQIIDDGEGPLRRKKIKPFRIAKVTVTNADFANFVDDTGYVTEAERIGWSFVFHSDVPADQQATQGVVGTEWWRVVEGATWQAPNGLGSVASGPDHPVVQVSWHDATAYARWCGGRLPTEAEWEHAARGGLEDVRFPGGDAEPDDEQHTAPARSFAPNGYGLFNMVGNVWKWTAAPFRVKSLKKSAVRKMESMKQYKLRKGGSYQCHRNYCYRYRIAARIGNTPDSAAPHHGFRVVWDAA